MRKTKKLFVVLMAIVGLTFSGHLFAQERNVSGTIKSNVDGTPIAGATVRLKGAIETTTTNDRGQFSVAVDQKSSETLLIIHPDFDELELVVIGKTSVDAIMTSNVRYNQYGQRVTRENLTTENRNGILTLASKDESFKFWTDMRVNADFTKHFDNYDNSLSPTGNPSDAIQLSDGAFARRARVAFKAQLTDKWYGEVDVDFRNLELDLNDVFVMYSINKNLDLKIGQFREPMGMMTNTSSRYVSFMERPLSAEFDPSRHMGIGLEYSNPYFMTGFGVFTDEIFDVEGKDTRRKQRQGTESSWAVTGRIMGYAIKKDNMTLGIGVGGSYRTPEITDEGYNTHRVRIYDENRVSQKRFLDTDAVKNVKNIFISNAELAFAYNSFRLQGEYKMMTLDRGKIYTDINYTGQNIQDANYDGYYVEAGFFLFGDKANFDYSDGEFTRVAPKAKWGTIELAARYSTVNLNDAKAEVFGGAANISTFSVIYWAKRNVRIILNAAYVDHDEHATSKYYWDVPANGFDYWWVGTRFEVNF